MKFTLFFAVFGALMGGYFIYATRRDRKEVKKKDRLRFGQVLQRVFNVTDKQRESKLYRVIQRYIDLAGEDFSVEAFVFTHILVLCVAVFFCMESLMQLEFKTGLKYLLMIMAFGTAPQHAFMLYKMQRRNRKITEDLTRITGLMYYQSMQDTPEDVVFFECARMVEEPLQSYFVKLGTAYKTKQSQKSILKDLRRLSNVSLLHSLVLILENRAITGRSENNLKILKDFMKAGKLSSYRIKRDARRIQLLLGAAALTACFVALITVPKFIEMFVKLNGIKR